MLSHTSLHDSVFGLPFVTEGFPPVAATFDKDADSFVVDEVPAYPPSGDGEHVMMRIQKRNCTTPEAVDRVARALGASPKATGWAGLKDKDSTATQWISIQTKLEVDPSTLELDGVRVLEAAPHRHKLRPGHLKGNRFSLLLQTSSGNGAKQVEHVLQRLQAVGVPNYFGTQRFGNNIRSLERALAWISGLSRPPRQSRHRSWDLSVVQSAIFNRVVADRVRRESLDAALPGDVMKKLDTGGLFVAEEGSDALLRAKAWEISATGPMFGAKMMEAEGAVAAQEEACLSDLGLSPANFAQLRSAGAGTRRTLRAAITDLCVETVEGGLKLSFHLPKGAYATGVVRELLKTQESSPNEGVRGDAA